MCEKWPQSGHRFDTNLEMKKLEVILGKSKKRTNTVHLFDFFILLTWTVAFSAKLLYLFLNECIYLILLHDLVSIMFLSRPGVHSSRPDHVLKIPSFWSRPKYGLKIPSFSSRPKNGLKIPSFSSRPGHVTWSRAQVDFDVLFPAKVNNTTWAI